MNSKITPTERTQRTRNNGGYGDSRADFQILDKTAGFVTLDPTTDIKPSSTTHDVDDGNPEFMGGATSKNMQPTISESESMITITHPGVIEDLIDQSEKRVEKVLMKRLLALSENQQQNVTELYQNLQKKMDSSK